MLHTINQTTNYLKYTRSVLTQIHKNKTYIYKHQTQNSGEESSESSYCSLSRHRRRTFLLYKETGMQKWAGMLVETGKAFVDPSAMMTQMREDSDFWSLSPLTILCWRTHLVITKHPEDGHGIAQMGNTTTRLITFW